MSKRTRLAATKHDHHKLGAESILPPATTAGAVRSQPAGATRLLREFPSGKRVADEPVLALPSKAYANYSFGPITEGHYTEF